MYTFIALHAHCTCTLPLSMPCVHALRKRISNAHVLQPRASIVATIVHAMHVHAFVAFAGFALVRIARANARECTLHTLLIVRDRIACISCACIAHDARTSLA
eukprot:6177527-Pleurochrysis_carterae.AAC.2